MTSCSQESGRVFSSLISCRTVETVFTVAEAMLGGCKLGINSYDKNKTHSGRTNSFV